MDLQDVFISNLKQIRKEKHITQEKLAEMCETDTAYIGQIETRKRFPSIIFVEKIAAALDVKAYLLFKDGSQDFEAADIMLGNIRDDLLQILDEHVMDAIKKNLAAS
ncbi:MAG: helix-turn-helix transcriptional regulator [Treponema sp.]|nr:helix-turn-helix transcriptional regulator [Treponema sp.]